MSGILTPGYLRWDGTKYVLDSDVEIVGPSGGAGPTGPAGPAGPPGPNGTASGDLLGTYPGPISVVGLTGVLGIVTFGAGVTNPTITQTSTGGTTGQTMTLKAQAATFNGGNVVLQSGTGTTAGLVQFLVGNTLAGEFDPNGTLRVGPNGATNVSVYGSTAPIAGNDTLYSFNNTSNQTTWRLVSGATTNRAVIESINSSAGASASVALRVMAAGASDGTTNFAGNGILEQVGTSTSFLLFSKALGDLSSRSATGRIFQSGAWGIGDTGNTSSSNQAGLTGPLLNFATATGSLTTSSGQGTIFKTNAGGADQGTIVLQGNTGVNLISATTSVASTTTTKFITSQGRRIKITSTTTSPYTVLASDEVVSIGTFAISSTTIASGSNGVSLPTGTINVASTTGFATAGTISVITTNGAQTVTYTNTTGTTFTGCSGGTGVMATGNTVTSVFVVNLPASPTTGDTYTIKDANGNAGTANITVNGNGANIDGGFSSITLMINFTQALFTYNGTTWVSSLTTNVTPTAGFSSVVNVPSGGTTNVLGFDQLVLCDPTSSSCTVLLPANPVVNMRVTVKDATATSNVHPIIIQGNGRTLENPISPGTYASPINITSASLSATWTFDPTRNRYTMV